MEMGDSKTRRLLSKAHAHSARGKSDVPKGGGKYTGPIKRREDSTEDKFPPERQNEKGIKKRILGNNEIVGIGKPALLIGR